MATGYGLCVYIVYKHCVISCMGTGRQARQSRTKTMWRSYSNRAMPMQWPCSLPRFCTEIIWPTCGLHTDGGPGEMVR